MTLSGLAAPAVAGPPDERAAGDGSIEWSRARSRLLIPAVTLVAWAYLATMIGLVVWVALTVSLTGWSPMVVTSESMRPALSPGDVIMIGPQPSRGIGAGTIVSFVDSDGLSVTHRVVDIDENGGLITKGDASSSADRRPVQEADVAGVGRFVVPFVGAPLVWLRSGSLGLFGVFVVVTILDLSIAIGVPLRERRKASRLAS